MPIGFVLDNACEQAGSRDFTFVGAVKISSLRLRREVKLRWTHADVDQKVSSTWTSTQKILMQRSWRLFVQEFHLWMEKREYFSSQFENL